jgi:hypothetical protein
MDENSDHFDQIELSDTTISGIGELERNSDQITFGHEMSEVFNRAVDMCFDEEGNVLGETSFILTEGDLEYSVGYRQGGIYHSTSPKRRYDTEGEILNGHVHPQRRDSDELTETVLDTESFFSSSDLWNIIVTHVPTIVLDSRGKAILAVPTGKRTAINDKTRDEFNANVRASLGGDEAGARQSDIVSMNMNISEVYGIKLYRCEDYNDKKAQFDLIVQEELLAVIRDNRSNS